MTDKEIMTAFVNIAKELYKQSYGDNVGEEVTVSADMITGKRIVITITQELKPEED
ncbi:MAG: hypothetical protein NC485_14720 [Ruminococcus flavefaciens]|nr:hypothetical protein [Ruminococcus flavefaciens]